MYVIQFSQKRGLIKSWKEITENKFKTTLPISKKEIEYRILTGKEEKLIEQELKSQKKINSQITPELTTRLRHIIISVDGDSSDAVINSFVQNMLARDSLHFRTEMQKAQCDIDMTQEVEIGGDVVTVDIPMTTEFFWPSV